MHTAPASHPRKGRLAYAIDFGTSNSLLAATVDGKPTPALELNPHGPDSSVLRSILYSPQGGSWYFGDEAIARYGEFCHEGRIFRSLKKFLPDPAFAGTRLHGKTYSLVDLIGLFLRTMRERANELLGHDVTQVVLGKPARYSADAERDKLACDRMEEAAKLAGFSEVAFCPEPVAAAYEFRSELTQKQTVLVADFGGGTSDFTILRMDQSGFEQSDILALNGVSIAGDAFDGSLMRHAISPHFGSDITYRLPLGSNDLKVPRYLIEKMCSPADISFLARSDIMRMLQDASRWALGADDEEKMQNLFTLIQEHLGYELFAVIESCKKSLSSEPNYDFYFEQADILVQEAIVRSDFQVMSHPLVEQITSCLDQTVADAGLSYAQIDLVCCTGGTAHLPALRHSLQQRFGEDKLRQFKHFHSVIQGLAAHANQCFS